MNFSMRVSPLRRLDQRVLGERSSAAGTPSRTPDQEAAVRTRFARLLLIVGLVALTLGLIVLLVDGPKYAWAALGSGAWVLIAGGLLSVWRAKR